VSPDIDYTMQISIFLGLAATAVILVLSAVVGIDMEANSQAESSSEETATQLSFLDTVAEARFHILFAGFSSLFLSLFTCVLLVGFSRHQDAVWRIALAVSALVHANGTYRVVEENLRKRIRSLRAWLTVLMGLAFAIVSAVAVFGFLPSLQTVILLLGILWALFVTSVSFVSLLTMRQYAPRSAGDAGDLNLI